MNNKDFIDYSTLTILGKTEHGRGFFVMLSESEKLSLLEFLAELHGGSIKLMEVTDLGCVPWKEVGDV